MALSTDGISRNDDSHDNQIDEPKTMSTIAGNIYGVILNDRNELERLAPAFDTTPYRVPPQAPVVYMKPRATIAGGRTRLLMGEKVLAAATLALLFSLDATGRTAENALDCVGAICVAIDLALPETDYFRPAVRQRYRDNSLVLGDWGTGLATTLETHIDGHRVHSWPLTRLTRPPARLVADLSSFMTFRAGDILLIGLPGDPPIAHAGQSIRVSADGLPSAEAFLEDIAA